MQLCNPSKITSPWDLSLTCLICTSEIPQIPSELYSQDNHDYHLASSLRWDPDFCRWDPLQVSWETAHLRNRKRCQLDGRWEPQNHHWKTCWKIPARPRGSSSIIVPGDFCSSIYRCPIAKADYPRGEYLKAPSSFMPRMWGPRIQDFAGYIPNVAAIHLKKWMQVKMR